MTIGDNAYNTELYKRKDCKRPTDQEDYCTPVYDQWCRGKEYKMEHQEPTGSIIGNGGSQSSARPKQMA